MKTLLLVRPNVASRFQIVPSPGLGYVAQAARIAGWDVTIYDAWLWNHGPDLAAAACNFESYDTIGIQVFYDTVDWTREFIERSRPNHPESHFIIGGPQASVMGWKLAEDVGADCAIKGPGEKFFTNEPVDIPAWDLLNLPAYWPYMQSATIPIRGKRPASIVTSFGCKHHCTFCAGHVVHGREVRLRSVQSVMEEIKLLRDAYGVDEIWIHDDNFLHDPVRAKDILSELYALKLHIRFPNGVRCENVDEYIVSLMAYVGVYMVGVGIESGNQRVLRAVKKGLRLQVIRDAVQIFHEYGIMTSGFFIVGLPPERKEDVEDSIRFALSLPLDRVQVGVFTPYPGSEDAAKIPYMDRETSRKIQRIFTIRFYLRPRILWSMLRHLRWSQIKCFFHHPWLKGK